MTLRKTPSLRLVMSTPLNSLWNTGGRCSSRQWDLTNARSKVTTGQSGLILLNCSSLGGQLDSHAPSPSFHAAISIQGRPRPIEFLHKRSNHVFIGSVLSVTGLHSPSSCSLLSPPVILILGPNRSAG